MHPIRNLCRFMLCVSLALGGDAFAQVESRTNTISVSGDAQVNVAPDKIVITLGVETTDPNLAAAKSANDASCARVLSVAQSFKMGTKDVQTDFLSIQPNYDTSGRRTIINYTVRKSMVVTLRDVPRFDAFLSAAVESGANVVLGIQFLTSDLRQYRDQARTAAMKAAKEKADLLAAAVGQKAGKAISITAQPEGWWSSYSSGWERFGSRGPSQNVSQGTLGGSGGDESGATAPGQTQISATVQVVFQLID